jgi:hypothetical protein
LIRIDACVSRHLFPPEPSYILLQWEVIICKALAHPEF